MQIDVWVEVLAAESIDHCGKALWDMAVAKSLSNDGAVLALGQLVVIGVAGARLGLFHPHLLQQALREAEVAVLR